MRTWQGICLSAALFTSLVGLCSAQSTPESEYKQLIRVNEDIQPLGEHPFGENISLYDGLLSFSQTDISLAGTGPLLQLVRQYDIADGSSYVGPVFGGWHLALPHLETLIPGIPPSASDPNGQPMWNSNPYTHVPQKIYGWDSSGSDLSARCSQFSEPPTVVFHLGDPALTPWEPYSWWKGYHLVVPGESDQDMLVNLDAATQTTYPSVTKDHWRFSCLSSTANGQPGEGFLGQAPDGTKYWFDELVYLKATGMSRQLYSNGDNGASLRPRSSKMIAFANTAVETLISVLSGSTAAQAVPMSDNILRSRAVLLVTKIQDRFGNTLNYHYDAGGLLTGITASDGRVLSIAYEPGTAGIVSVTLQPASGAPRTWIYSYSTGGLTDVQLPDNSHWHYDFSAFDQISLRGGGAHSSCLTQDVPYDLSAKVGTITHPSGLVGQFTIQPRKHGRSFVPQACEGMDHADPDTQGSYALVPDAWYGYSVTQEVVTGAGLPSRTWTYNYSPPNDSWADCSGTCPTTIWTDVIDPDNRTVRNLFSNRFGMTESQLQRTEYYSGAAGSTLLRAEDSQYAPPTTSPLPTTAGTNLQYLVNSDQTTKYSPLNKRVITQDGRF